MEYNEGLHQCITVRWTFEKNGLRRVGRGGMNILTQCCGSGSVLDPYSEYGSGSGSTHAIANIGLMETKDVRFKI